MSYCCNVLWWWDICTEISLGLLLDQT
jgi:hypothetical protein